MLSDSPIKLNIPRQDLNRFSLFDLDADSAHKWAQGLPVTNTRSVVQQLRHALSDLNHVQLAPEIRFTIMEALRPKLNVALANLSKRYLNQPLIMPEEPRQMAEVADSLYSMASTAYTIVAIEAIQQRDAIRESNPARLTCDAIMRALDFAGGKILQTYQLYNPMEPRAWLNLHQLYALAEEQGLATLPVADPLSGSATIAGTYLQALMLGCCKPNQMRQNDLAAFYLGLREWSSHIELMDPRTGKGLFLVNLDFDQPPVYSWLYNDEPSARCRLVNTEGLIEHLEQLKSNVPKQGIAFDHDTSMPANILDHLIASLGSMSLRNFNRTHSNSDLSVCFGLSSTHYHLSGEQVFEQLLYGSNYVPTDSGGGSNNPFLQAPPKKGDKWQQANPQENSDNEDAEHSEDAGQQIDLDEETTAALLELEDSQIPPTDRYPIYMVPVIDASPGGYCLEWTPDLPADIKTGDIVSLKEAKNKEWMIAVIRWLSHPEAEDARTQIGLELLSPRATPYGACIQHKTGAMTAPMRVLLLPEIKLVGQPHTLITPRAGFRERQKITLIRSGEEFFIQLLHPVTTTGTFAQFNFRYIKQLGEMLAEDKSGPMDAAYDSLWSNI